MKILKYMDFFGFHFHFYVGNKRKLYTSYGGIISLIYILCCICIFLILCLKDLLRKNPISNMSSVSQAGYHKVKFGKEKLWIPWRIIDFNNKFINFTNLIYPNIYIIKGEKNITEDNFLFKTKIINYKLCNETDFKERGENYFLDIPLSELYCMEIDNIELGGGWTADFLNYIRLEVSICKDGIEYDENNKNCTTYQNLRKKYSKNNFWAFEYFYPVVEFQPTNYEHPVLVKYRNHFYNFSSKLNKEERIYIQEYVLNEDKGLVFNDEFISSFWGYISSDFDVLYSKGEELNEKHSSILYSLNIFLDSGKIVYTRRYNKVYTIFANVFPIFNGIFFIFNSLTFMAKTIMTEKYLSELFFQRINEHDTIKVEIDKRKSAGFFYHKYKLNLSKKNVNNYNNNKIQNKINNSDDNQNKENNDNFFNNDISFNEDNNKNNFSNFSNIEKNDKKNFSYRENEEGMGNNYNISKNSSKDTNTNKSNIEKLNDKFKKLVSNNNNPSVNNSSFYHFSIPKMNNFVELNTKKTNYKKKSEKKTKNKNKKIQFINKDMINNEINDKSIIKNKNEYNQNILNNSSFNFFKNRGFNNTQIIRRFRLKGSLFNMKDYIYSYFIKAIRNEYKCLSKEFSVIFNFLSEIYDVSSYLQLYKQFHIISGFLLENVANVDINHKININNKELFEQLALKNKNVFYFALKERITNKSKK